MREDERMKFIETFCANEELTAETTGGSLVLLTTAFFLVLSLIYFLSCDLRMNMEANKKLVVILKIMAIILCIFILVMTGHLFHLLLTEVN